MQCIIRNLIRYLLTLLLLVFYIDSVYATSAYTTYFNQRLQAYERFDSNNVDVDMVSVVEMQFYANQVFNAHPEEEVVLSHQLINTGDVAITPTLNWQYSNDSTFTLANFNLVMDVNNNGIPDLDDPIYAMGQPLPQLAPGELYNLLLVGDTPLLAAYNTQAVLNINVLATPPPGYVPSNIQATVIDTIRIAAQGSLKVSKSANVANAVQLSTITYMLSMMDVNGAMTQPISVMVDGVTQNAIVLRDTIPRNTVFQQFNTITDAQVVYHVVNTPLQSYVTAAPSDITQIDAIAFLWSALPASSNREVSFSVMTGADVPASISNIATAYQALNGTTIVTNSNEVILPPVGTPQGLAFYTDNSYSIAEISSPNVPFYYLAIDLPQCVSDPNSIESYPITVNSVVTGDSLTVNAVETAAGSGFFTAQVAGVEWNMGDTINQGDTTLAVAIQDQINAFANCGNMDLMAELAIGTGGGLSLIISGSAFDSRNQQITIPNAQIDLYQIVDGEQSELIATQITNAQGFYQFNFVPMNMMALNPALLQSSDVYYQLVVTAEGYATPSQFNSTIFADYSVVDVWSYNGLFQPDSANMIQRIDIPLDPFNINAVSILKTADLDVAQINSLITYTVSYVNPSLANTYTNVVLEDQLPNALTYVAGSAKLNGNALSDPTVSSSNLLTFSLPDIASSMGGELSYQTQVNTAATGGSIVNNAQIKAAEGVSNNSWVSVNIVLAEQLSLMLTKEVNKPRAELGNMLMYTLRYQNPNPTLLHMSTVLNDILPNGFAYVAGSAKFYPNGETNPTPLADPTGAPGANLAFSLGDIPPNSQGYITYLVKIRNSAPTGRAINQAQLASSQGNSNIASVQVLVEKGDGFEDEGFISGMVYLDCNNNRLKDVDEPGVPGVRIYMEDGTFVITDQEGRYSIYGMRPRTHVMKLDPITLPHNTRPTVLNNRAAKEGNSQFVDLKKGELHRTDFALQGCGPAVLAEIKQRRDRWQQSEIVDQLQGFSDNPLTTLDGLTITDPKIRPAQGLVTASGNLLTSEQITDGTVQIVKGSSALAHQAATAEPRQRTLSQTVVGQDNQLGFIALADNQVAKADRINLQVKGQLGSQFKLRVNGQDISHDLVGERALVISQNFEAWEYIGVPLQEGNNNITVTEVSQAGITVGTIRQAIRVPGRLSKIELQPLREGVADGITPLPVMVKLFDNRGTPILARTAITLESSAGVWDVNDSNAVEPGIQAFIEGGEAVFDLTSSEVKSVAVRIHSGTVQNSTQVNFLADIRPLLAVGIIDGAVGLSKVDDSRIQAVNNTDNFEQTINTILGDEGQRGAIDGRIALFLKGKVQGDYLLTLAYDSDKDTQQKMFRDIDPTKFYPVYGDDSIRGFEAQSTEPLYVRIDKGHSYVLYGDYQTDEISTLRTELIPGKVLGRYNRNLTGAQGEYVDDKVKITYFAAYSDNLQQIVTIPALGTSGPYDINLENALVNSEQITLVVRSREQPDLILYEQPMTRFTDYVLDLFGRSLLFSRPIPMLDEENNPIEIRITYEVDSGGEKYWIYGLDGEMTVTDSLTLGASVVKDRNSIERYQLSSVRVINQFSDNHALVLEAAQSEDVLLGKGQAYRAEWVLKRGITESTLRAQRVDDTFVNERSGIITGQQDLSGKIGWKATDRTLVSLEGIYSKSIETGSYRTGGLLAAEYALTPSMAIKAGLRHAEEIDKQYEQVNNYTYNQNLTSAIIGLAWSPERLAKLRTFLEAESVIKGETSERLTLGAEYMATDKISLYGRHDLISDVRPGSGTSSLPGTYGLIGNNDQHITNFGMKYHYKPDAHLYSEYRTKNALSGLESETAVGVNQDWQLTDTLTLTTGFENIKSLSGQDTDATAATVGIDYLANQQMKTSSRVEWRDSTAQKSWLAAQGATYRLQPDWTVLASNIYAWERKKYLEQQTRIRNDLRFGIAYRDTATNKLHVLGRYHYRRDNDQLIEERTNTHVVSTHFNYQYNPSSIIGGRYAIRYRQSQFAGFDDNHFAQLGMLRLTHDLTDRIDISCMGSELWGEGARQQALGCETGYLFGNNIWLSLGYNAVGFFDSQLAGSEYTNDGIYLRMRIKFDENAFNWLTE